MKFRVCPPCGRRTPHEEKDGVLQCVHCPPKPQAAGQEIATDSGSGLKAALLLCADYPHAANCFLIHTMQIVLRICSFIWIFAGIFKQGFFTSAVMVVIAFFIIGCFGPRGRDKLLAVEFRRIFWTTLLPR